LPIWAKFCAFISAKGSLAGVAGRRFAASSKAAVLLIFARAAKGEDE
jgi:hypothetical protein